MRIEISARHGAYTVSHLKDDLQCMIGNANDMQQTMQSLIRYAQNINGGVGSLLQAVEALGRRADTEQGRCEDLDETKRAVEQFIQDTVRIDGEVAEAVAQNQEAFYQVNAWARPSAISTILGDFKEKLGGLLHTLDDLTGNVISDKLHTYFEVDYNTLSDEAMRERYEMLLQKAKAGELSEEDKIRINAMMHYLFNREIGQEVSASDVEKMKMFNEMYTVLYPEQADKLAEMREYFHVSGDDAYMTLVDFTANCAAYDHCSDAGVAAVYRKARDYGGAIGMMALLNCMIESGGAHPMRTITAQKLGRGYAPGMDDCFSIGNANVYNAETVVHDDGSADVSFTLSNQSKCYTEVTVFDKDGNVVETHRMDYQKDGGSPLDVAVDTVKLTWDGLTGNFTGHDRSGFNSKQDYSLHIPAGGYCRITEDSNLMLNQGEMELDRLDVKGHLEDAGETVVKNVIGSTGSEAGDLAVKVGRKVVKSGTSKALDGKSYSWGDSAKTVAKTVAGEGIEKIAEHGDAAIAGGADAGLGPLSLAYKGTKKIVEINSKILDPIASGRQQSKRAGEGAMYIYASTHPEDNREW